ncbi:MAG: hypothetical protein U0M12_08325 [Acutalibacteraceae bacterium]|nr:hypothetical protein [Acutalibacteraceae bacterium]
MNSKDQQIQDIINSLSKKLGENPDKIKANAQKGDIGKLLGKMDSKQASKVQSILNDKEQTEKILKTPQAQALLKKLMGDK